MRQTYDTNVYLFGTKTCPNCKMAKKFLDEAKVKYDYVDAEVEKEKSLSFGIKQAPSLVVVKDGEATVIGNLSNIKKYIGELTDINV